MSAHGCGALTLENPAAVGALHEALGATSSGDGGGESTAERQELCAAYCALAKALALYDPDRTPDEGTIPSGVVYLAQLMAHDLILSVKDNPASVPTENAVCRPLMLDTIYGLGPDSAPHLYAPTLDANGTMLNSAAARRTFRPYFRERNPSDPVSTDLPRLGYACPGLTHEFEAVVADRRNDSHSIIAQITAQWMQFHNVVFRRSANWRRTLGDDLESPARYRERFRLTRAVVRRRWHDTLEHHVFPHLLCENSRKKNCKNATGMPSVLSRIALRSLHCLPLREYLFDEEGDHHHRLREVLNTGSHGNPRSLEDPSWKIHWPIFFFNTKKTGIFGNRTKFRPAFDPFMLVPPIDPSAALDSGDHIASADLRLADLGGALDIPKNAEDLLPGCLKAGNREITVRDYLKKVCDDTRKLDSGAATALEEMAPVLADRPPLLLVILLEAETVEPSGAHLGRWGSSLLAPWLFGALQVAKESVAATIASISAKDEDIDALVGGGFDRMLDINEDTKPHGEGV